MHIVAPQENDLPDIQRLLENCQLPYRDLTSQHLDHFLVARDGPALAAVGGLELHGPSGLLRSLAVLPEYRAQGLGRHMVAQLETRAGENGITALYLLTTTAERFFTHLGYCRQERTRLPAEIQGCEEFRRLCPEDAVCMFRAIA
jgi:amino-acid N-acetyltransferase